MKKSTSRKTTAFLHVAEGTGMSYPKLEIDPALAEELLPDGKNKQRIVLHFPNGKKVHRALQRSKDGFCFIGLGKSTLKEGQVEPNREIDVLLEIDTSEYGMAFPEEFKEVLQQDPEAKRAFEELNPGMKRSILYYIDGAKSVDSRIKRALDIAHKAKTEGLYHQRNSQ